MPANRKPAGQRQDNRPQRALVPVANPGFEGDVVAPTPRPKWLKATKASWADYWSSQVAGAVQGSDMHEVFRLFDFRDDQGRALARWRKNPYVTGSQGQPVANPAFAESMALEKAIVALEDRLGCSVKSRASVGVDFGHAALTVAQLNKLAKESAIDSDDDEALDAELAEEWEAG